MTYRELLKCEAFVIILRCLHCRGQDQQRALRALNARGLWLSTDQKAQAGLVDQ